MGLIRRPKRGEKHDLKVHGNERGGGDRRQGERRSNDGKFFATWDREKGWVDAHPKRQRSLEESEKQKVELDPTEHYESDIGPRAEFIGAKTSRRKAKEDPRKSKK